jgi:hypothetical protein
MLLIVFLILDSYDKNFKSKFFAYEFQNHFSTILEVENTKYFTVPILQSHSQFSILNSQLSTLN